jgi:hypothetical protein
LNDVAHHDAAEQRRVDARTLQDFTDDDRSKSSRWRVFEGAIESADRRADGMANHNFADCHGSSN